MEDFKFDYDSENDDLFIYSNDRKSSGSVELGDFILDLDENLELVSLQIMNVSDVLRKLLTKIDVNHLREVKLDLVDFRNMGMIKLSVMDHSISESANLLVPSLKNKSPVFGF